MIYYHLTLNEKTKRGKLIKMFLEEFCNTLDARLIPVSDLDNRGKLNQEKVIELLQILANEIKQSGIKLKKTVLFGSYATKTNRDWSDVDVAFVANDFSGIGFNDVGLISKALLKYPDLMIQPRTYHTSQFNVKTDPFVEVILKTGIIIPYVPMRPGEPDCTYADITRIKSKLGWKPTVTIEKGVAEMLKNIEYWREAPVWDPASIQKATEGWFKYLG